MWSGGSRIASPDVSRLLGWGLRGLAAALVTTGCTATPDDGGDVGATDDSRGSSTGEATTVGTGGAPTTGSGSSGSDATGVGPSTTSGEGTTGGSETGPPGGTDTTGSTSGTGSTGQGGSTTGSATAGTTGPDRTRRVFATSGSYTGDLGGTQGADQLCQNHATGAGLGGTWRAWLSVPGDPAGDRLDLSGGPFTLIDGTVIADDSQDLLDGSLDAALRRDEYGVSVGYEIWTGTLADGSVAPFHCDGFTVGDGGDNGRCGDPSSNDASWTDNITPGCGTRLGLYCFEQ